MELSGLVVSFIAGLLLLPAGARGLREAGLVRQNYRGRECAFPLGALIATTGLVALAPLAFLDDRGDLELLDPGPGRAEKALVLLMAGLCLGAWTVEPLEVTGVFLGAALAGAALTLREKAMLGDTGSNLIGAIAGVALLTALGETGRLIALL